MKLEKLKLLFFENLSKIYSISEISTLFDIFSAEILGLTKIESRQKLSETISESEEIKFLNALNQLKNEIPYQYILGEAEFFGLKFNVSKEVLIPRPETEELVEFAIQKIQSLNSENFKILDIGTGSGIIPIILKKNFPQAEISAIDFSDKALKIAKENAEKHQAEIHFIFQDYLHSELTEKYDVIISNPPYIGIDEESEIENSVKNTEPKMALFSPSTDSLVFYRKIAKDAEKYLTENGQIFLEINQKLGAETLDLFRNFSHSELVKDISGNDRFIWVQK
ncbi:release factor glutamine methyltransferase [Halpernia humi]|uniref:peptide chain release factor N(5)-glutamine methyltransferase n=1 Tax=Halpernia humi TaxID=493375 RepID=A0A1H5T6Y5_9FLAO|nr:peptide chain release factor N(5)-glutamine methyltransferase [Halpernia humi]SEF58556.1 release factor glutamine methyltransferase [Halpernia humi]